VSLDRIARFEQDLVVQAGAGTGKTHALVTLYLHLVGGLTAAKRRTPPPRIAVVTFTDKAAGELKERIRSRLSALALTPRRKDEPTLAEAARELKVPLPDSELWLAALAQLGGAPLGTFHSFAGALLRRHAAAAGIDPDFVLLDELEASQLASEAAERAVLDGLERDDPAAVELVAEYGYRRAGRADRLVAHLVKLRAARAEEGRGALEVRDDRAQLEAELAESRNALAAAIASLESKLPSLSKTIRPKAAGYLAQLRNWRVAADVLEGEFKQPGNAMDEREAIKSAAERLQDAEAGLRAAPLAAALAQLVAATEQNYAAAKRRSGSLDFTDLLVLARDLLRDDPQARDATRARFDAVLVDEFQDTNPVQAELVELIAGPPRESGRRFVVGDRKQSIYEFRGADVGVFTRATTDLLARGGREELLKVCRRALPELLRLDNDLFANAMAPRGPIADWALTYDPAKDDLLPFREGQGVAELLAVTPGKNAAETRALEARAIASRLHLLHAEGRGWGDCAILLRRFTALGDYLDALRSAQIPHYVVRGRGFFAAQEVRDLGSALTLLDDPDDTLALVSVLRSPLAGVSDETLARLALAKRLGASLWKELPPELPADERARVEEFRERFAKLRRSADRLGPAACVRAIIDGADVTPVLATTREGEQRIANLERLVERARAFEAQGGDLREFVAWLRRRSTLEVDAAQAQLVDEHDDVVRVMTVHQAKGLEFPVVLVPACGAKELPDLSVIRYDAEAGLGLRVHNERAPASWLDTAAARRVRDARAARRRAESLRLFYVAATRAKDVVIFSGEPVRGAGDCWRTWLDQVDPSLLKRVPADQLGEPPRKKDGVQFSLFADGGAERSLQKVLVRPPPRPREITAAVTQLADFQLCPRRYLHFHALGLAEHPAAARAPSLPIISDDEAPPLDALRRGTLAHRLLERCRFDRVSDRTEDQSNLDEILLADGYDSNEPDIAEVRQDVARFLDTPFARGLAGRALRRELPFLLSIPFGDGARLLLRGQIDLLILDAGGITVIDYKHARRGDDDDYRFQLDAYALAAHQLYPSAPSVSAGLVFLKEGDATPDITPLRLGPALESRLARLGEELAAARATNEWPGRPLATCRSMRCGYVYRCHS
jgi:ATP-dependent exoDNAse (exonuclease V) beta subunit